MSNLANRIFAKNSKENSVGNLLIVLSLFEIKAMRGIHWGYFVQRFVRQYEQKEE